jgi:hypothetical protein
VHACPQTIAFNFVAQNVGLHAIRWCQKSDCRAPSCAPRRSAHERALHFAPQIGARMPLAPQAFPCLPLDCLRGNGHGHQTITMLLPHYITIIQQSQFNLSQYCNKHTTTILPTYIQPQHYHNVSKLLTTTVLILPQYYHIHGHGQGHGHGHGSMARNSVFAKVGLHAIRPCTILDCTQLCVYYFTYI